MIYKTLMSGVLVDEFRKKKRFVAVRLNKADLWLKERFIV